MARGGIAAWGTSRPCYRPSGTWHERSRVGAAGRVPLLHAATAERLAHEVYARENIAPALAEIGAGARAAAGRGGGGAAGHEGLEGPVFGGGPRPGVEVVGEAVQGDALRHQAQRHR